MGIADCWLCDGTRVDQGAPCGVCVNDPREAASPAPPVTREALLAFLDGTKPLEGVYFGQRHPTEPGAYWWRKHLGLLADPVAPDPVVAEIERELQRAAAKFPTWPTDPLHACGIVQEESGELAKAVLQVVYEPHKSNTAEVRAEAVQTAAMAIRFIRSIDAGAYDWTPGAQHVQVEAVSDG